jgi:polyisoprenoid-binding protein YceI
MKNYFLSLTVAMTLVAANVQTGAAEVRNWLIDEAHSNLYFSVDHIYSKIHGHFNKFKAEIKFDPANPAGGSFYFEVSTDSVDTNIAKRDKHLQSSDFFDSDKFPLMTFTSVKVTDAGNNVYEVEGKFNVKGTDYDLTLPLTLAGVKPHPAVKGKDVAGFNGRVTIDRLAHGVGTGKFYKMGVVGKDVEIFVSLEVLAEQ